MVIRCCVFFNPLIHLFEYVFQIIINFIPSTQEITARIYIEI